MNVWIWSKTGKREEGNKVILILMLRWKARDHRPWMAGEYGPMIHQQRTGRWMPIACARNMGMGILALSVDRGRENDMRRDMFGDTGV